MNPIPELPIAEFAFPGPLRDHLVALVRAGVKTATTSTLAEYRTGEEPLPQVGGHQAVVDSAGHPVAVIETTSVVVVRLADVTLEHVRAEGEGHTSVGEWRATHERFWSSELMRAELADAAFRVTDDTEVVLEGFRLVTATNMVEAMGRETQ